MQQKMATLLLIAAAFVAYWKFILKVEGTATEKMGFLLASTFNNIDHYSGRHESDYRSKFERPRLYGQIPA